MQVAPRATWRMLIGGVERNALFEVLAERETFMSLAMLALLPALQAGELWSSRYDWRYFETMTEMARRTVAAAGQCADLLTGLRFDATRAAANLSAASGILAEQQPMFERAQPYLDDPTLVKNIVADGCERARKLAQETMRDVREAMGLGYA